MNFLSDGFKKNVFFILSVVLFTLSIGFLIVITGVFGFTKQTHETSIGFIYLGSVEEKNYEQVISTSISKWKTDIIYEIEYQNIMYEISMNDFELDLSNTIENIKMNQNNLAIFGITPTKKANLFSQLSDVFSTDVIASIDQNELIQDILSDMARLKVKSIYRLTTYMNEDDLVLLLSHSITSIETLDVNKIIETLETIHISEKSRFSLLNYTESLDLNNQQLSIIASGILPLIRSSQFTNINFHTNTIMPSWANHGENVRILKVNLFDLSFLNPFDQDYTIEITKINDTTLKFDLIGFHNAYQVDSHFEVKDTINFQTIYVDDETIDENTPGVVILEEDDESIMYGVLFQAGVLGSIIYFYRTTTFHDASSITSIIAIEVYYPSNEIYYTNTILKVGG